MYADLRLRISKNFTIRIVCTNSRVEWMRSMPNLSEWMYRHIEPVCVLPARVSVMKETVCVQSDSLKGKYATWSHIKCRRPPFFSLELFSLSLFRVATPEWIPSLLLNRRFMRIGQRVSKSKREMCWKSLRMPASFRQRRHILQA